MVQKEIRLLRKWRRQFQVLQTTTALKVFLVAYTICNWHLFIILHQFHKFNDLENKDGEEQSVFRTGRSCTDNIFCMKQVIEKRNATNQETHLLFVDLTKAYDSMIILKLWEVLGELNINNTLIKHCKIFKVIQHKWKLETHYPTLLILLRD